MDEKELFRSFNDIDYSDEEIQEYIDLGNITDEEMSSISGAVKTKMGIAGIAKTIKTVHEQLEEDEYVEKIIKVRDIEAIYAITVSSALGGTIGGSLDYGVFDALYFTNKRIFLVMLNVANQPLSDKFIMLEDMVGIRFTTKVVELVKDENTNELKIKLRRNKFKMYSILYCFLYPIYILVNKLMGITDIFMGELGFLIFIPLVFWILGKSIEDAFLDKIQIAFSDGYVWRILIASDDYWNCRKYIMKLSKKFK